MLQEAKRLPEAADALQQAIALTAEVQLRFQARRRLGTIYIALQEADKARTVLRHLAHDDMDPAVTAEERLRIGLMLQRVEAYESSLMLLHQASNLLKPNRCGPRPAFGWRTRSNCKEIYKRL